jgi:hypothetical protein
MEGDCKLSANNFTSNAAILSAATNLGIREYKKSLRGRSDFPNSFIHSLFWDAT